MINNSEKLKTSSRQNNAIISYKIDTGSNRNIMPMPMLIHVFIILFLRVTKEKLAATENKGIVLKHI